MVLCGDYFCSNFVIVNNIITPLCCWREKIRRYFPCKNIYPGATFFPSFSLLWAQVAFRRRRGPQIRQYYPCLLSVLSLFQCFSSSWISPSKCTLAVTLIYSLEIHSQVPCASRPVHSPPGSSAPCSSPILRWVAHEVYVCTYICIHLFTI